jgi:uncharacterized protein YjiS (DUF1127 family)
MDHAMTALSSLRTAALPALRTLDRAGAAAAKRVRHVCEVLRNRRDAAVLASFNERMLADIGLTRSDLRDAFAEPPWRDPTAVLVTRAQERRTARRRGAGPWPEPRDVLAPSIVPQVDACDADHPVTP